MVTSLRLSLYISLFFSFSLNISYQNYCCSPLAVIDPLECILYIAVKVILLKCQTNHIPSLPSSLPSYRPPASILVL